MKHFNLKEYTKIQERESAMSRGTEWGERLVQSIIKYKDYIQGYTLDLGCGDGLGLETLEDNNIPCMGVDISKEKVEIAKSNGLDAMVGEMEKLPFLDKTFDTVFCSHTLEHSHTLRKACSEIQRVGHRAVIIVPIEERTPNIAHIHPIKDREVLLKYFDNYKIVHEETLNRTPIPELVLILDFEQ